MEFFMQLGRIARGLWNGFAPEREYISEKVDETWDEAGAFAEKVENWLRILMAIAAILPAVMIGIAALGGEDGQFTLPQNSTTFIVAMALAVAALVACALLQFFFGRRGSGGTLGTLFLGLAIVPLWAALDHGKMVFEVWWVIQTLMAIPILGLFALVIWIGPLKLIGIGLIPRAVNAVLKTAEAVGGAAVKHIDEGFSTPLPRVPSTGKMLSLLGIILAAEEILGIYLCYVTIGDEPKLIIPFVVITLFLFVLTLTNKAGGFRALLWIALIAITLIFALGGQKKAAEKMDRATAWLASPAKEPKGGMPSGVSTYNPNAICPMPALKAVSGGINDPLGIKFYGDFMRTVAEDSGIAAKDGGTFAKFSTPEKCIDAGKQLLRSETGIYAGQTMDWAMRKWSNNGYGAEVAAGTGIDSDAIVGKLDEKQMDALLAAMAKREGVSPAATALPYVNPNDHSKDQNLQEFTVALTEGCFGDWVRVPRYWNTWESSEFVVSNEPIRYVGFWFFGWSRSRGPFGPNNIPDWTAPPNAGDGRAKWRLQGKGVLRYVQTS